MEKRDGRVQRAAGHCPGPDVIQSPGPPTVGGELGVERARPPGFLRKQIYTPRGSGRTCKAETHTVRSSRKEPRECTGLDPASSWGSCVGRTRSRPPRKLLYPRPRALPASVRGVCPEGSSTSLPHLEHQPTPLPAPTPWTSRLRTPERPLVTPSGASVPPAERPGHGQG